MLSFFAVSCSKKNNWIEEQIDRKNVGLPLKCPHCTKGWGFIYDNETDQDEVYCVWKGNSIRYPDWYLKELKEDYPVSWEIAAENAYLDDNNNWRNGAIKESLYGKNMYGQEFTQADRLKDHVKEKFGEKLYQALYRLRKDNAPDFLYGPHSLDYCYNKFTKRESEEGFYAGQKRLSTNVKFRRTNARRRVEAEKIQKKLDAAKSPEQKELEKINRQLKELKDEIKKNQ
ncbi:hypothetical protein OAH00_00765 [bacterium]|nr:hypothetical protein [bacterium]